METDKICLTIQKCHDCSSIRAELLEMKSGLLDSIADLTAKFESHDKTFKQFLLNFGVNFESAESQEGELSNEPNSEDLCDNSFLDSESPIRQPDQLAAIIREPGSGPRDLVDQTIDFEASSKPLSANSPSELDPLPECASEDFSLSKRVKIEVDEELFASAQPFTDDCEKLIRLQDGHPGEVAWNCLSSSPSQHSAASATAFVTSRNEDYIRPTAGFAEDFPNLPFGQSEKTHFSTDCDAPGGSFNPSGFSPRRKASRNNKQLQNKTQSTANEHLLSMEQLFAVTSEYSSTRLLEESSRGSPLCPVSSDSETTSMFLTDSAFLSSSTPDTNIYKVVSSADMRLSVVDCQSTSGISVIQSSHAPFTAADHGEMHFVGAASSGSSADEDSGTIFSSNDWKLQSNELNGIPIENNFANQPGILGMDLDGRAHDASMSCASGVSIDECDFDMKVELESNSVGSSSTKAPRRRATVSESQSGAGISKNFMKSQFHHGALLMRRRTAYPNPTAYRAMILPGNVCQVCGKTFKQKQHAYRHARESHIPVVNVASRKPVANALVMHLTGQTD